MTWADPRWLWAAAAAPVAAVGLDLARRRALRAVRRLAPSFHGAPRWRALLPAAAIALLSAALARPQWGFRRVPAASPETDVVFLLDTSGSMLARDAAPDRFGAARLFARDLLRRLPETARAGIVRVEGEGEVICPLTLDRPAAESALEELTPRGASAPGSDLGRGVRTAEALLSARPSRVRDIVLLSDGEDLDADLADAVAECRRRGIRVDAVAVGTESGAPVPARTGGVLTEGGSPVVSRAHPRELEGLARQTGGTFTAASNPSAAASMAAAFRSGAAFGKGSPAREPVSRAAWPLAGAVAAWGAWSLPRRRATENAE